MLILQVILFRRNIWD